MALLNLCMKFKNFFGQKTSFEALWKWLVKNISIPCSTVRQIQDLGQSKYKLRHFSKRTHGISKILFIRGFYESLASLESKIGRCPFFGIHNCKKTVWMYKLYLEIDMCKFVSLQVSTQILPQMQPELPEKRRKPAGHAAFPGLLSNLSSSHPRGRDFRFLWKHVCPQQLQTWTESQERWKRTRRWRCE